MNHRMFIVFEGVDGSGKSTQIGEVEKAIRDWNKYQDIVLTREPTYKAIEVIKKLNEDTDPKKDASRMSNLFDNDRKVHYNNEILPDLLKNRVVICDRYSMSTLAYQSTQGRQMQELIHAHIKVRIGVPDITFYMALSTQQAMERISKRGKKREKFEQFKFIEELVNRHEFIYNQSLEENSISRLLGNVVRIDASREMGEVTKSILVELEPIYKEHTK